MKETKLQRYVKETQYLSPQCNGLMVTLDTEMNQIMIYASQKSTETFECDVEIKQESLVPSSSCTYILPVTVILDTQYAEEKEEEQKKVMTTPVAELYYDSLFTYIPLATRAMNGLDNCQELAQRQRDAFVDKVRQSYPLPEPRITNVSNSGKVSVRFSSAFEFPESLKETINDIIDQNRRELSTTGQPIVPNNL